MEISYIIPFYNNHDFLPDCLASIARHTSVSHEIIIIDDSSPDTSYLRSLNTPNIRVFFQARQCGPATARNIGIRHAQGDYLVFIDSDDLLIDDPARLIKQVHALEAATNNGPRPADLLIGLTDDQPLSPRLTGTPPYLSDLQQDPVLIRLQCFTTVLYRRGFLADEQLAYDEDMTRCDDVVFLAASLVRAKLICITDIVFYHYRARDNSLSHSPWTQQALTCRLAMLDRLMIHLTPCPEAKTLCGMIGFIRNLAIANRVRHDHGETQALWFLSALSTWARQHLDDNASIKHCKNRYFMRWVKKHDQILQKMRHNVPTAQILDSTASLSMPADQVTEPSPAPKPVARPENT